MSVIFTVQTTGAVVQTRVGLLKRAYAATMQMGVLSGHCACVNIPKAWDVCDSTSIFNVCKAIKWSQVWLLVFVVFKRTVMLSRVCKL